MNRMNSKKFYAAVDLGATSGRVILGSIANGNLEMTTMHRFPTPIINIGKKYYWNIYTLYEEIITGLRKIASTGTKVESIGIDTWGVDFACIGKDGSILSLPRAYRDPYTSGVQDLFFNTMPAKELYNRTGIQIMNINSVFQLFMQKKEKSSALMNAAKILFMPDALSYMLTGNAVCEYTILSTSAIMDPRRKKLDREVLRACGVKKNRFGKIVYPGHKVGKLTEEVADKTGLGRVPVIAVAGHDTASAVASVPAMDEHFAYLSSGTWSLMGIETKDPVINDKMFELNFTNEGGVNGTTRLLKNITGMWLLEQCLARWRDDGKEYSYEEVTKMASGCNPSDHLIDPDDDSFASPTDMPEAIAEYCTRRGWNPPVDDAACIRLIYDSLAAKYADTFAKLKEIAPFEIDTLHIIGGGSKNELLNQMTADACGVRVVAGPSEGTALGNIMIQAKLTRKQIASIIETKTYIPVTK